MIAKNIFVTFLISCAVSLPFEDRVEKVIKNSQLTSIDSQKIDRLRMKRSNGRAREEFRWPNKTVPYFINTTYISEKNCDLIFEAMRIIEDATCVRFKNHTNEKNFLTFTAHTPDCKSKVGMIGGEQFLKLAQNGGCFKLGKVLHEIVHSLGFQHIHRGADRDKFIKILWHNVKPNKRYKFDVVGNLDEFTDFGVGYDFDSIMHKKKNVYSKNNKNTIETLNPEMLTRIGQRDGLSKGDILKINRMYKCDEITEGPEEIIENTSQRAAESSTLMSEVGTERSTSIEPGIEVDTEKTTKIETTIETDTERSTTIEPGNEANSDRSTTIEQTSEKI